LAQFEEQAVQDYVCIVNRWADHEEKTSAANVDRLRR
jgi:hypothetical protein